MKPVDEFSARTKRLRAALNDSATGPLEVAKEVVAIAEDWERWRAKAGGVDLPEWLRELHPEHKLSWYRERARAFELLGPTARELHHSGAVMIVRQVPGQYMQAVKEAVHRLYRHGNKCMYVTTRQARKVIAVVLSKTESEKKMRVCRSCVELEARIKRLEAQVRRLGEEPAK